MAGILRGRDLTTDQTVACDVCIVGSGAGGSVLAAGLAERGLSVVMLEAGSWNRRSDFISHEASAFPNLYQERGGRSTVDRAITILQGIGVGGSTTVNWTTCFRTPDRILEHWAEFHGIQALNSATLAPHFAAVEERLNIHVWNKAAANENNKRLIAGGEALGFKVDALRRNVKGCANSGYCGMGCPVNAKQAMHLTYIPDAVNAGMRLYANTNAERLVVENDKVVEVLCSVRDEKTHQPTGVTLRVRPQVAVSSGGAINSPALLLKSGLDDHDRVGRRTFLHPVVGLPALYDEEINPFYGAPQAVGSHHFIDRGDRIGFFLETAPLHPTIASISLSHAGESARSFLTQLAHTGIVIALHVDGLLPGDEGGTTSLRRDGRVAIDYPIREHLTEGFRASHQVLAKIALAAGAREVFSLHSEPIRLTSEADLPRLKAADYGALRHSVFSAHQMGGCAMGATPETSVVSQELRHHRVENLFVVDGSVFPTALGVNPSQSIYGLAHYARAAVGDAV